MMNIEDWSKLNCHKNLTNKDVCDTFINSYINWIFECVKESKNKKIILKLKEPTLKHRHKIYELIYKLSKDSQFRMYLPEVKKGIYQ